MYKLNAGRQALFLLLSAAFLLSACATKKPGEPMQMASAGEDEGASASDRDPLEGLNRALYKVHEVIDGVLLKPLAHIYRGVMPEQGQNGVRNVLSNAATPVVLLNSLLQGDMANAGHTTERFVVNTTVGIGGIFDVASRWGIPKRHDKDFGQTMGVYGVGTGPYLMIPVLGPSDARDVVGLVADIFSDPLTYILTTPENYVYEGTAGLVKRTDLLPTTDMIDHDSLDPYATIRSMYLQHRDNAVAHYRNTDTRLAGDK